MAEVLTRVVALKHVGALFSTLTGSRRVTPLGLAGAEWTLQIVLVPAITRCIPVSCTVTGWVGEMFLWDPNLYHPHDSPFTVTMLILSHYKPAQSSLVAY